MQVVEQQLAQPEVRLSLPHLLKQAQNLGNTCWITRNHDIAGPNGPSSATSHGGVKPELE